MTPFVNANSVMFRNGEIYANLHTTLAPSGEGRGQALRGASCFVNVISANTPAFTNENGISVYPNPASDQVAVNIKVEKAFAGTLRITDLTGRVLEVSEMQLGTGTHTIDVNIDNYSDGMYILQMLDRKSGTSASKTFVKAH